MNIAGCVLPSCWVYSVIACDRPKCLNPFSAHPNNCLHCFQDGWTPLHRASWNGHTPTAQVLLDRGASVTAVDKVCRGTPFCFVILLGNVFKANVSCSNVSRKESDFLPTECFRQGNGVVLDVFLRATCVHKLNFHQCMLCSTPSLTALNTVTLDG